MCIDIMEIWFGIANGQIHQIFTELSARDTIMAEYYSLTFLFLVMTPTSKKLEGHIASGLFVRSSVRLFVTLFDA